MKNKPSPAEMKVTREFDNIDQTIPESMPILDDWIKKQKENKPFKGITALLIQHQFGNQFPQTKALIDLGLDPEKLWWLDIPYTSSVKLRSKLETLGIPKKNLFVHDYHLLEPYSPYQMRRVQKIIKLLMKDNPDHLLVLDDGSYFLEAMATLRTNFKRISIVEQTSRGIIKINENATIRFLSRKYPVINVARSAPKLLLESPFIGRSVCRALSERLKPYLSGKKLSPVLLIGFGAIGQSVAASLQVDLSISASEIYVYDRKRIRQSEARKLGYNQWNRNDFTLTFRLVVGCTGSASFKCGDYTYLRDGAVLASASSGTVELSRQDFIELADSSKFDDLEVIREILDENNLHSDIRLRLVDREVIFLNGGFPVNFSGTEINCVPTMYMQPTTTLMVASAVQAVKTKRRGLIAPHRKFCLELNKSFRDYLGFEAEVLL